MIIIINQIGLLTNSITSSLDSNFRKQDIRNPDFRNTDIRNPDTRDPNIHDLNSSNSSISMNSNDSHNNNIHYKSTQNYSNNMDDVSINMNNKDDEAATEILNRMCEKGKLTDMFIYAYVYMHTLVYVCLYI
jgi:hypothetical protein